MTSKASLCWLEAIENNRIRRIKLGVKTAALLAHL